MALTERLRNTNQVSYWTGEIPMEYIYTCGRAGERFYRTLKDKGTFLGAHCDACNITYVPPRIYCEKCFARLEDQYREIGISGTVHTFTLLNTNLDGSQKDSPAVLAMVKLDGSDGGVVHYLGETAPDDVYIGLKVEAVLKPEKDRKGAMADVKYFRPAQ